MQRPILSHFIRNNWGRQAEKKPSRVRYVLIPLLILGSISLFLFLSGLILFLIGDYGINFYGSKWKQGLDSISLLFHSGSNGEAIAALVITGSILLIFWAISMIALFIFGLVLLVKWLLRVSEPQQNNLYEK